MYIFLCLLSLLPGENGILAARQMHKVEGNPNTLQHISSVFRSIHFSTRTHLISTSPFSLLSLGKIPSIPTPPSKCSLSVSLCTYRPEQAYRHTYISHPVLGGFFLLSLLSHLVSYLSSVTLFSPSAISLVWFIVVAQTQQHCLSWFFSLSQACLGLVPGKTSGLEWTKRASEWKAIIGMWKNPGERRKPLLCNQLFIMISDTTTMWKLSKIMFKRTLCLYM